MTPQEAARKIIAGALVVFPTETVYGLGALATDDEAVKKIFEVKGRPSNNPLILHIAENSQLKELVLCIPEKAKKLMNHFWPGPLTICFRKSKNVSDLVTAGLSTVCIRRPDHSVATEFLKNVGAPVAAPSANISGSPSTTRIEDAQAQLEKKGVFFLDGGKTPLGIESTVIEVTEEPLKILRHGALSKEAIEAVLDEMITDATKGDSIKSPGETLEHYAPLGQVTVLMGDRLKRRPWIKKQPINQKCTIGFIGPFSGLKAAHLFELTSREEDLNTFAARLYTFLNWCDRLKSQDIVIEFPNHPHHLREALLDRLKKASSGNLISV